MITKAPQLTSDVLDGAVLPLFYWPDDILHQKCDDIQDADFGDDLNFLIASMFRTMKVHEGVGLSAPQVGVSKNIITIHVPAIYSYPFVMINPEIVKTSIDTFDWDEGCLSVPTYFEKRSRPNNIVVEYLNDDKTPHRTIFTNLHAFVIQHEIDHLNGHVFVDSLSQFKQQRIEKKIHKLLSKRI